MKQYLNFSRTRSNYSFKHSFDLIFSKIETVFFSFLCVIFLIISKVDGDFSKKVSFAFVNISMPVMKFTAFPFNVTANLLTNFSELVEAKKKNEQLNDELNKLKSLYIESLNIRRENKELRDIMNFVTTRSNAFKVARIIGYSHQAFNKNVFLDAGENRDIQKGSIVIGKHGVVGRIVEVAKERSRLMLLTDPSSRIPVITSKSRTKAILAGNGSDTMEMLYLPKNHNLEAGDWVFTSGDGDVVPLGLFAGVVKKVDKDYALVTMVEDVNNVDIVTIMTY